MKTIIISILFLAFGLASGAVQAQSTLILSLDSAVSYAIQNNRTLINSKYAIDKTRFQVREAITQGLPQVNASIDYTNYLGAEASLQLNPLMPPAIIEFNPTSNFKASVSQLIFNGSYYTGIQMAKLAKTMSEQSYLKDELNVKEQTIQAYYLVLASERILDILKKNKKNVELIYEKTGNLAKAQLIEETDVKQLSIMVTSVDNALKSAERQVELGYNLLRLQLGLPAEQNIKLSTSLEDIALTNISATLAAGDFNISNNLDYQLILMQGEMAKKNVTLQRTFNLPSIVAYYSYTEKIKEPLFDMTPKNVLGFTLNIPVFSSGQRLWQVNHAKVDYEISKNTKELMEDQLSVHEKQLRFNYNNLLEQYISQKTNVEIAEEVLENMQRKYAQDVISILELTNSNNDYLTAESNYTNIMLQLLNAELALRKINNKL